MTMIKIIKDLDITASGVSVFNRKWQPVHLQQGEMDGACAVYSMMMNLLILKVLTRNQVVNLKTTFKGNTAKGRLANSTSKCKITKCFCKSTPLVLRNSISFLVSH